MDPVSKVVPIRADRRSPGSADLRVARNSLADLTGRLRTFRRLIYRGLSEPRLRRASINELQNLRDHELRDIGIERREIETLVDDMLARKRQDE
jgi:uncharacterized protein YjiS (DUF1127 family)